ncbi:hypothetical protein PQX77_010095 [Marasmius sp. AFHP31]|nr:hypothetical protein PQX77_010095 [Marasmius sp. AFHP31]
MEEEKEDIIFSSGRPYLRLYEDDEGTFSLRSRLRYGRSNKEPIPRRPADIKVTLDADESQDVWDDLDAYRYFHVMRFFNTLEGFYTGELDLTGRHPGVGDALDEAERDLNSITQRFQEILSTFSYLLEDMNEIRKTVRRDEFENLGKDGEPGGFAMHTVMDDELWKKFRLKWKIPRVVDFDLLDCWTEEITKTMANGWPKIQKVFIMDLPPELIHYVFKVAKSKQARLLASTCKRMQHIGTSPHIYRTRSLTLHFVDLENQIRMFREAPEVAVMHKIATETSEELVSLTNFLASRPKVTQLVRNLRMTDHWRKGTWGVPSFRRYVQERRFYDPIRTSLNSFLASCSGLSDLTITYFAITTDWLVTLSQLANLRTIRFMFSRIVDSSVEVGILDGTIPSSPHVLNVVWHQTEVPDMPSVLRELTREPTGHELWYTLLLFPHLKNLFRQTDSDSQLSDVCLPSSEIRQRCNIFCKDLCRVCIGLAPEDVVTLTEWITLSHLRTSAPCSLTHLKLHMYYPLPDHLAISLLESLSSAPMQVLVLADIKNGSLALVERIVQLFPDLVGLTLTRQDSQSQKHRRTKRAIWPHQSGEYASRFQGFRKLRYFEWNFNSDVSDCSYGPVTILVHEAIVLAERFDCEVDGDELYRDLIGEEEVYSESDWILATMFGGYCPTLEVMVSYRYHRETHSIVRGLRYEGQVFGGYDRDYNAWRDWNPDSSRSGWDHVLE